jgi:hypothetical protein
MAAFMHEQEEDETERELPSPHLRIDPDHQQHGAAGFQQDWKKFQERQKNELELREKLRDHDANYCEWPERFFHPAPGCLFGWRFVLLGSFRLKIHGA